MEPVPFAKLPMWTRYNMGVEDARARRFVPERRSDARYLAGFIETARVMLEEERDYCTLPDPVPDEDA
ncbi:hypothetical protein ACLKMY_32865 [Paraburkholderia mimosarum]|uniref:hypothetical protein n=1 Tax=Paraburkholderia mimosarum TaxID=312026 RepID=UPI0039C00395